LKDTPIVGIGEVIGFSQATQVSILKQTLLKKDLQNEEEQK
jgi:hypothetical protein